EYEKTYGPGDYRPNIPVTYWTFRMMITAGAVAMVAGAWILWATRRRRTPATRWLAYTGIALPLLPLFANSFGWIFTEMGRQPWLVFGLLPTEAGVSPGTTVAEVGTSLAAFTLLYGALAIVEVRLLMTYLRKGLPDADPPEATD